MLFTSRLILCLATGALFAGPQLHAAERHNLILIIPQALPAAGADRATAPALTRLRNEGVDFVNSHAGFPKLSKDDDFEPASRFKVDSLIAAAARASTSVAFIDDERTPPGEQGANLQPLLDTTLPHFKSAGRPFFLVYRLAEPKPRAPGDIAYRPSARAADAALAAIETRLRSLGLFEATNIVVAAEYVLSRVQKTSHTSAARTVLPREETLGTLPPGFLAIDILAALKPLDSSFELFDPDNGHAYVHLAGGENPMQGNAIVAANFDPSRPYLKVEAHGAHDSIYFDRSLDRAERKLATRFILNALFEQDYLGGVFLNERRVGKARGTLPLDELSRADEEDLPDIVVAFATSHDGCANRDLCTSVIADTPLPEGEGIINSFNRAGTRTFMAARGPDFRAMWTNDAPASNEDLTRTIATLLQIDEPLTNVLRGRVLTESLAQNSRTKPPKARTLAVRSKPAADGSVTEVLLQTLSGITYFDSMRPANPPQLVMDEEPSRWRWLVPRSIVISISGEDF